MTSNCKKYLSIQILQASFCNSSDHIEKVTSKETPAFKKALLRPEKLFFSNMSIAIITRVKICVGIYASHYDRYLSSVSWVKSLKAATRDVPWILQFSKLKY